MSNPEKYLEIVLKNITDYAPKFIGAIVLLILGLWISKRLEKLVIARLKRSNFSPEITSFLGSMFGISLKVVVVLVAAGMAGFDTSALVGMVAAAGFAVGLALQGGLRNFASGILILIFKPYKVGDWIDIEGKFGKVEEIQIFNTLMISPGLKTLIIPNGQLTEKVITNYSKKGHIRLEIPIPIPYSEDFERIKNLVEDVLINTPQVLQEPAPTVGIETYEIHSLILLVKPFVHPDDFWDVRHEVLRRIKAAFYENNVLKVYPETIQLGKFGT
jgi:small conductance mechanosensitive channel